MVKKFLTAVLAAGVIVSPAVVLSPPATAVPATVQPTAMPKHTPIIPGWCYLYRDQYGRNHWICIR